jgi:hypothetical protein
LREIKRIEGKRQQGKRKLGHNNLVKEGGNKHDEEG